MKWLWLVLLGAATFTACKTGKPTSDTAQQYYLHVTIDTLNWAADSVVAIPMGNGLLVKGTDATGRVFSFSFNPSDIPESGIMLLRAYTTSFTWAVKRKDGFNFWTKSNNSNYIRFNKATKQQVYEGQFEVRLTNGSKQLSTAGYFRVPASGK